VANGSSLVLAYHNVIPRTLAGRGDVSLHLPVEAFVAQLRVAAAEADLVSLPVLLAEHGRAGRRVAVTFDDAYAGCLRYGLPACHAAGVSPTVFVAPALLGRFAPWDVWASRGQWSEAARARYLHEWRGIAADHAELHAAELPEDYRIGTLPMLHAALAAQAFDIGNHTARHVNLGAFGTEEAVADVRDAARVLEAEFPGRTMPALAYPYGIAPRAALLSEAGFTAGFLVSGGWIGHQQAATGAHLPRLNVPAGISVPRFAAQLRGWLLR
jgi:peptidoglycan/xylan/chitin deacetylase (PgdA/CDA1 family)